jgi:hypothetical protein
MNSPFRGEAAIGVEPMVEVLQTSALPLGYAACVPLVRPGCYVAMHEGVNGVESVDASRVREHPARAPGRYLHTGGSSRRRPSAVFVIPGSSSPTRSQSLHVTCLCIWSSPSQ